MKSLILVGFLVLVSLCATCHGAIPKGLFRKIEEINKEGSYLGIVVPNAFELGPLISSPSYVPNQKLPYLDFGGRRFRFATIGSKKVIVVMTGLALINAGTTTQLLLNLFRVEGVLHPGIAGNADPSLQIGDVTIAKSWAHLSLWNWQRYGDGENDLLPLEENGDYTRKIGFLKFSDYNNGTRRTNMVVEGENLLNRVWYQPEEIFPVYGVPEERQHAFWVSVDRKYLQLSDQLKDLKLEMCANATTCLPRRPKVVVVEKGCSSNIFVDNAAYRQFIRAKFNVTPVDMESAGVALICLQHSIPFLAFRSFSDLAGGGLAQSNEASLFEALAAQNAAATLVQFVLLLGK